MTEQLLNHLWQSTLFAGAIGLLTLALRSNSARLRYWLWLGASVKFLIPFSLLVSLGSHFGWREAAPPIRGSALPLRRAGRCRGAARDLARDEALDHPQGLADARNDPG